jgi:hypothetical protein
LKYAEADLEELDVDLYNRREDNIKDKSVLVNMLNAVRAKISNLNSQEIAENAGSDEKIRALKADLPEHLTRWRARNRHFFDNWKQTKLIMYRSLTQNGLGLAVEASRIASQSD